MIEIHKKNNCTGCSACYNACPVNCISMELDNEGFKYPVVNKEKCINCGLCTKICPQLSHDKEKNCSNKVYVCTSRDEEELLNSSSGGIFSVLAKEILRDNGVVYGAGFNEQWKLLHKGINKQEDLCQLRKSKYIESEIGLIYKDVKANLIEGKKVLFCGTPCQVAGLKHYLQKEYDNLVLVDFICHGIPSQVVYKKYLEYIRKKIDDDSNIKNIDFRFKRVSWEKYETKIEFESGKVYNNVDCEDYWMKGFLQDIHLRPSCYFCINKGVDRFSDITLADAWGIREYSKALYHETGTSLVISHTQKGDSLLVNEMIKKNEIDEDFIKSYNVSAYKYCVLDMRRNRFYKAYRSGCSYDECVDKAVKIDLLVKIERRIRKGINILNGKIYKNKK